MKRNILNTLGVIAAALVMAGCASLDVDRDWQATGGSKSDGIIRLSYEQTEFERVNLSESQAVSLATKRCRAWGYPGKAEAFGGVTKQCTTLIRGFSGCANFMITKEYQCQGSPTK